jgi:hypothetical protein
MLTSPRLATRAHSRTDAAARRAISGARTSDTARAQRAYSRRGSRSIGVGGSVDGGQLGSDMARSLAGSGNQQGDRGRAEMQHQDQQELHDYGGPQQHTSRVYSDETRLTQAAARPGLSDPQAAARTMIGRHQDSPTKGASGEIRSGTGVVKSRAESPPPAVYGVVQCADAPRLRCPARRRAALRAADPVEKWICGAVSHHTQGLYRAPYSMHLPRPRHTRPKPGSQSHGSSPSSATPTFGSATDASPESTTAELPGRGDDRRPASRPPRRSSS